MKTLVTSLLFLTILTSCDAPQRTRSLGTTYGSGLSYNGTEGSTTSGNLGGTTSGTSTSGSSTSGTTNGNGSTTLPSDFSACNTGTPFYSAGIGYTSLCQSTATDTSIRVMFTTTDQDSGTCLIPTYKDSAGNSMYLGQAQCTLHNANQVIYGSLPKTRSGFSSYPLNGAMIMKRTAINAYFTCMDAYVNFVDPVYCPYGAKTSPTCDQTARNYMTNLCNQFKSQNSYMDIRLKN